MSLIFDFGFHFSDPQWLWSQGGKQHSVQNWFFFICKLYCNVGIDHLTDRPSTLFSRHDEYVKNLEVSSYFLLLVLRMCEWKWCAIKLYKWNNNIILLAVGMVGKRSCRGRIKSKVENQKQTAQYHRSVRFRNIPSTCNWILACWHHCRF